MRETTTAILGGGLTGLTLGHLLYQEGMKFQILEKEPECGGLLRSLQRGGFTFDYGGSHVIFSKDEEVLNFMLQLLQDNKIRNRRNTKIFYKGLYVKYPFENGLGDLSTFDNFDCLNHFVQALVKREKGELGKPQNLKEWFYYTFGKGISERYLIPYNLKVWKFPLEKIGLEWVERVPSPPVEEVIKSSLGMRTEGYTHQLYFYYPKVNGIQSLIDSLREKIEKHITLGFEVRKIRREDKKWIVSNGREERIYDLIISTIPIHELVDALDSSRHDASLQAAKSSLRFNSLITVMIGINETRINDLTWLYIPDNNVLPHRVSFPSNYSPCVSPEGKSSLLAEITCHAGDETWKMRDQELADLAVDDLDRLRIIEKEKTCFSEVRRTKYAYVVNDLTSRSNLRIISSFLGSSGIDGAGRFAEFRYLNMDGCIRSAMNFLRNEGRKVLISNEQPKSRER